MPAKSTAQRKAAGAALAIKRWEAKPKKGTPSAQMAASMSEEQISHFAKKKKKKPGGGLMN